MAMTVTEVQQWLASFDALDVVWIDEGGLMLEGKGGAYLEVGGEPEAVEAN